MSRTIRTRATVAVCIVLLTAGLGCQTLIKGYAGRAADPEGLIPLASGGPHKDLWQGKDLYVAFAYEKTGNTLSLSGEAELDGMYARNFSSIESFHLQVHFADAGGTILQSRGLAAAGRLQDVRPIPFDRTFQLPEGAASMIFSYAGRAAEGGGGRLGKEDGGVSFDFWQTPLP